jgi:hypothetical protein
VWAVPAQTPRESGVGRDYDWGDLDALLGVGGLADEQRDRASDADGVDHVDCDDYRNHQRRHRYVAGRWVCDVCAA